MQVTKPAHMVHVHSPLPLKRVALGDDGQFVVQSDVDRQHMPYEKHNSQTTVQWSDNLPECMLAALADIQAELIRTYSDILQAVFALGKSSGSSDLWLVQDLDYDYPKDFRTWTGSDTSLAAGSEAAMKEWPILTMTDECDQIVELFYAPNDWYFKTKDGAVRWQGLPESLDANLVKYSEAYSDVEWL